MGNILWPRVHIVPFRKKPKQRQFFLFNDILVYGNIVISKKRYNKQRIIALENVQLEDLPDDDSTFTFLIKKVFNEPSSNS